MATVIELLGGECTGKTRLAESLRASMNAKVVPEELRSFVRTHRRTPHRHEQADLMRQQQGALHDAIAASVDGDLIVCDPSPLMTAVYSAQYFDDDSLMTIALDGALAADLVVWCQPDLPWQADGLHRDGPQARAETHRIIEEQLAPLLPEASLVRAAGDVPERLAAVRSALRR